MTPERQDAREARRTEDPSDPAWLLSDAFVARVREHLSKARTLAIRDLKAKGIVPAG